MKYPRTTFSPRLAMVVAGVGFGVLIAWWTLGDHSADRSNTRGGIALADSSGGPEAQAKTIPPWASGEQKAKAAEREAMRRKKFELYAELTKGLPELQPKLDGIPEFEVNGFERLRALAEAQDAEQLHFPHEFREMLRGNRFWDSPAVKEYLKQRTALLDELVAISSLPSGEVDWRTRDPRYSKELRMESFRHMRLLLEIAALQAAYDGSPNLALDWMEVADRLSGHLRGPENAPGGSHNVGLDFTFDIERQAPEIAKLVGHVPGLGARMDALLESQRLTPADLARGLQGEAVYSALALLGDNRELFESANFEKAKSLLRVKLESNVRELEAMREAAEFATLNDQVKKLAEEAKRPRGLTLEAWVLFEYMWGDPSDLFQCYVAHETRRQLAAAAVRLTRDDTAPETILAEIAASETEPRKLHYDPATRTLTSEPFLTETEKISIQVP